VDVRFRRLTDDDLPLLHRWLNEPGVVRWWEGDDVSWDGVVADYGSASTDPTEHWLALVDEQPVGWIQCYAVADFPEESEVRRWWELGVDRTAAGIDYLVGEPAARGAGLGTAIIRTFVAEVVFGRHPGWTQVGASPLEANVASRRALEKAGFTPAGTFQDELGECRLMVMNRPVTDLTASPWGAEGRD
jgi:RimJ/RimL family protein N-acetyltransferase